MLLYKRYANSLLEKVGVKRVSGVLLSGFLFAFLLSLRHRLPPQRVLQRDG